MDEDYYEIIGSKKFRIPSMTPAENQIRGHIMFRIGEYLATNEAGYFFGKVKIRFDDENILVPDFVVVLKANESIIDWRGSIHGVPDMVVEVMSKSTRKRDLTVKKDIYEANGVREYWIIDPYMKAVSVYLLRDGKYFLDDEYILFDEQDLNYMTDEEIAAIKHEVPVATLDGLKVPLKYIFKWGYK